MYSLETFNCRLIALKQNNTILVLEHLTSLGYEIERDTSFNVALTYNYKKIITILNRYQNQLIRIIEQLLVG